MKRLITAVLAATLSLTATAHDMVPGAAQSQPILLQGGTLHTVTDGTLVSTDLLFENGQIIAIGNDIPLPPNTQVIDIRGQHVYPGLIALDTTLGLVEIEAVRATDDQQETGLITP